MSEIKLWVDGACSGNPGPGGWGVVMQQDSKTRHLKGGEHATTNNRMELTAAIKALEACPINSQITIYTDSDYVKQGITLWIKKWVRNGWKNAQRKPVKNSDLWKQLSEETQQHQIDWRWVPAHSGIDGNEQADALARQAILEI